MTGISKFQISRSLDERIKRIILGSSEILDVEYAQVSSAYILGFNLGNVTNCVAITTNYQLHHAVFPVVGLAFLKSTPNDEEIQAKLRAIKEFSSSPNGLGSFKSDKNEHLFLIYSAVQQPDSNDSKSSTTANTTKPLEIEKRLFNLNKGTFVRRKRLRLVVLNDPFTPRQIYNGTEDIFNLDDVDSLASAEDDQFDHLIFFIHGVGGVCDARFRSCVEVVADFKKMANDLLEQHSNPSSGASTPTNRHLAKHLRKGFFRKQSQESSRSSELNSGNGDQSNESTTTSPAHQPGRNNRLARRVECLPVSWHSLTRRQTGINDQLSLIALSSVPKLRNFIDKVVLDALLYSSGPCYTQTIINNVGDEINRLYTLFMEKHPNFNGSVSLAGHSLGSVIVFDLLAHQTSCNPKNIPNNHSQQSEEATSTTTEHNQQTTLNSSNNNNIFNNNNNNNNNNDNVRQCSINTREKCLNVGHHHHHNVKSFSESSIVDPRYCSDYTSLEELLKDLDLSQFASLFHKEHIDLDSLLLLTDFDMKELKLPLGARRKLGTYVNFKKVPQLKPYGGDQSISNTQQQDGPTYNPMCNMNTGQFLVEYPQLKFTPRCFFAFGSPTTMFLNIRGIQCLSSEYKLPTCKRMMNIYHPYDPLAYRMEPLIDPRFKHVEPILVPHHRGGKRIHVQLREGFARVGHDIKHRLLGSLRNTWSSFTRINPPEAQTTNATTTASSSASNSNTSSASQSMDELLIEGAEAAAIQRRRRLMKIQTSSQEFKSAQSGSFNKPDCPSGSLNHDAIDSIDQAASGPSLSPMNNDDADNEQGNTNNKQRKPLKRQQEFRRSQSEASKTTTTSDLNSLIEASFHDASQNLTGFEAEFRDANGEHSSEERARAIALEERLKAFNLDDEEPATKVDADADHSAQGKEQTTKHKANNLPRKQSQQKQKEPGDSNDEQNEFDTTKIGKLNMGRRIDYVLQEKPIELFNEYIFVATSHANYWQQEDSALLILKELYQVDNIQLFDQND